MSDQDLRDLLHDRVDDLTSIDLAPGAWEQAARRRRVRRSLVAGGVVLAVVLAAVTVDLVRLPDREGGAPMPASPAPTPSDSTSSTASPIVPDATYQGLPVWWSPDLDEELDLPLVPPDLMPSWDVDLTAEAPDPAAAPIVRAVAAFGRDHSVVLVAPSRATRRLPVDLDQPETDEAGYEVSPYGPSMLSPDGRHLVFPQAGSLALYDVARHRWSSIDVGSATTAYVTWVGDDQLLLPRLPEQSGPLYDVDGTRVGTGAKPPVRVFRLQESMQNPIGPARGDGEGATAQSWGMGPGIPVRDPATYLSGPASLVVTGGPTGTSVLAFMTAIDDHRWMDAPAVAGWLDDETVVYESIADDRDLLIAWTVGTDLFRKVASVTPGWTSSFARLG
ncbi:hypothetical protein ASC77_07890 [Nocardioides sp. Root1257]|uniref:hypothetical protein n=1 Tax=unclassified Nocardioides TaxID=2615069 RepID=UPI0006F37E6C|nr:MULTISPECIES: hypothetical protein [unclassified Nocardioides]KQW48652.1 hypothetical protein ASC77_07890 [Nocardioides sp. Root1257]KRC47828.1 hypothetical protein ASE24_07895 [Nocardioides sp. Root224]